jgi:hypothetical protein
MNEAVARARDILKGKQGVGMLYYAGHGLQIDARNYMVPVDAKLGRSEDVPRQTMDVGGVVEAFKAAGNRMNILVLDACRDNPFGKITSGRGLAPLDAPSGTFLAYATAPGNVAEDGDAKTGNGLYTQFLLQELKKPQARIEDVFKRVRFAVRKASSGRQIPWESTSLEDDFTFNDGRVVAAVRPTAQQLQAELGAEKQDWNRIKDSRNADDFYAFLQKYPNGVLAEAAHARLNEISRTALVVQGAGADGKPLPYVFPKFRLGDVFEKQDASGSQKTVERVVSVTPSGASMEISHGNGVTGTRLYDAEGGMLGMGSARYNPPQYQVPPGLLQAGKRWKVANDTEFQGTLRSTLGEQNTVGEGLIAAREVITVPAGRFDTFRIELDTTTTNKLGALKTHCTSWIAPELPTPVKQECSFSNGAPKWTSILARVTRG